MSLRKMREKYKDQDKFKAYVMRSKKNYRLRTGAFAYTPRPWNENETNLLFTFSGTDRELSKQIERSVSAIQKKRSQIKAQGVRVA